MKQPKCRLRVRIYIETAGSLAARKRRGEFKSTVYGEWRYMELTTQRLTHAMAELVAVRAKAQLRRQGWKAGRGGKVWGA